MRFRGQYTVVKQAKRIPDGFVTRALGDYQLLHHADLPIALKDGAALIGYCLDWRNPDRTQEDVLEYLRPDPLGRSSRVAGRWVFVVPGELAVSDGCGTMGIYYGRDAIASSAILLDYVIGPLTSVADPRFRRLQEDCHSGRPIPGRKTEYLECTRLLGNHYLDWQAQRQIRFHPTSPYAVLPPAAVAPKVADILVGLVKAAANRKSIAIPTTAGFDSRALISASLRAGVARDTMFFTFQDEFACPKGHCDLELGGRIVAAAGGAHE